MLDLEWRLAGLGNLVDPPAALGCYRFLLLLKASRIVRNIQETFEAGIGETSRLRVESLFLIKKIVYTVNPRIGPPSIKPHARASNC